MRPLLLGVLASLGVIAGLGVAKGVHADESVIAAVSSVEVSQFALELPLLDEAGTGRLQRDSRAGMGRRRSNAPVGLGGERARILLQSLTVPGWGQATLGRKTSATVFALTETGIWASFTGFRIQQQLRRLSYERTARLFAGIDLEGRNEEFRHIIGIYPSSDDYNRLVVRRDAANLHYGDPDAYNRYVAEHELEPEDSWAWDSEEHFVRYREERKNTQRAALRANTALGLAIANRLVSAIHAARHAGRPVAPRSWNLECAPVGGDPTAFHLGVRTRF